MVQGKLWVPHTLLKVQYVWIGRAIHQKQLLSVLYLYGSLRCPHDQNPPPSCKIYTSQDLLRVTAYISVVPSPDVIGPSPPVKIALPSCHYVVCTKYPCVLQPLLYTCAARLGSISSIVSVNPSVDCVFCSHCYYGGSIWHGRVNISGTQSKTLCSLLQRVLQYNYSYLTVKQKYSPVLAEYTLIYMVWVTINASGISQQQIPSFPSLLWYIATYHYLISGSVQIPKLGYTLNWEIELVSCIGEEPVPSTRRSATSSLVSFAEQGIITFTNVLQGYNTVVLVCYH